MVQPGSQANPKRIAVVDRGMDKGLQTRNIQHTLKSREPSVDGGWWMVDGGWWMAGMQWFRISMSAIYSTYSYGIMRVFKGYQYPIDIYFKNNIFT